MLKNMIGLMVLVGCSSSPAPSDAQDGVSCTEPTVYLGDEQSCVVDAGAYKGQAGVCIDDVHTSSALACMPRCSLVGAPCEGTDWPWTIPTATGHACYCAAAPGR